MPSTFSVVMLLSIGFTRGGVWGGGHSHKGWGWGTFLQLCNHEVEQMRRFMAIELDLTSTLASHDPLEIKTKEILNRKQLLGDGNGLCPYGGGDYMTVYSYES